MYVITMSLRFSQLRLALLRHVPDLLPHLQPLERELLHRVEVGEQEGHLQQAGAVSGWDTIMIMFVCHLLVKIIFNTTCSVVVATIKKRFLHWNGKLEILRSM